MTIIALPAGMTADKSADWGLIGFMANANVGTGVARITTAGTATALTAAQSIVGTIILSTGAGGGFSITFPTTNRLIAAMGPAIPTDGSFSYILRIKNLNVAQTGTVTVGDANMTLTGTATIATDTTRTFLVTVSSATTVVVDNLGSMAL